jgi:hypothetical protein
MMNCPAEALAAVVLDEGPFPHVLVSDWPEDLRSDYLQLLAEDLNTLGLEEFRHRRRLLGEAYLLSHNRPITSDPILLEAWRFLNGDAPPPEPPEFLAF